MKVVHSSFFRALCAIIVGALLIQYREQTVTWITIAIGVLFFLSGVISIATYFSAKRNASKVGIVYDANGKQISGLVPSFPIVGIGSLILGLILALMPNTFINSLMFILSVILIMGALTQFTNLATARKMGGVGFVYWIFPSIILLVGLPSSSRQPLLRHRSSSLVGRCSSMEWWSASMPSRLPIIRESGQRQRKFLRLLERQRMTRISRKSRRKKRKKNDDLGYE